MRRRRDDRVLPGTRAVAGIIVPFLIAAFSLWIVPGRTGWFAWTIHPTMTPMVMGAGYISGAYFFTRVIFARRWHCVHIGFLPITAFTVFMAIATLAHLDKFDRSRPGFWIWSALYAVTPILLPLLWLGNRATDPRVPEFPDVVLPRQMRAILLGAAAIQLALAIALIASPSTLVGIWPWKLTPLTASVLGGWFALPGMVALMMAIDARWSAIRVTLQSQAIGLTLILIGVARAWDEFDSANTVTYLFVTGIALLLAGLVLLVAYVRRLQRTDPTHWVEADATTG